MQAAAALQAERMRRALEARAVVAQVAEQKEAGRAAMAAAQVSSAVHILLMPDQKDRKEKSTPLGVMTEASVPRSSLRRCVTDAMTNLVTTFVIC